MGKWGNGRMGKWGKQVQPNAPKCKQVNPNGKSIKNKK
jgi:hypothetical protein